ncbi:MAG: hypothetical protein K1V72_05465 [Duncaniella sp.]|jgi:hypothetical protein
MKLQHIMFAILTAVFVGLASSCSKRAEILDNIPADVNLVATVNVDKLCSAVGVTLKGDGSAEVCVPMQGVVRGNIKMLDALAGMKAEGVADIDNIVVAVDKENVTYAILSVSDIERFDTATSEYLDWNEASNGYRSARLGSASLLAKDGLVWSVTGARDAVKSVDELKKRAREMSVAQLDGIAEVLGRDNMVNVAVASGLVSMNDKSDAGIDAQDKEWSVAAFKEGADNSLVIDWEMMKSTGLTIKPKGMQNINPALLAYVPENFNVTLAFGLTKEFDWEPLRKVVMLAGGFQTAAFMSVVNPYLESIDGTVLMAAAPSSPELMKDGDVADWDFIVMVHMPQDKINSLMSMISSMMSTSGMTPTVTADGLMAIPQYGKTMYIGNVDGYLGISTIGFDNTRNNSLAPTFVNKDMAANVSLMPYSDYIHGAPEGTGVVVSASMDNGRGVVKLKADGTQWPVLVFLLTAMK